MNGEPLFSCPRCQAPNFTRRGLRSHVCRKNGRKPLPKAEVDAAPAQGTSKALVPAGAKTVTLSTLDVLPPVPTGNPDAEMGAQLTEQYHRATGGMVEVLKFGAMMIQMEEAFDSARGAKHEGRGRYAKGSGFKGWLKEHAPDIKEGTAYRLRAVTESIAERYETIVGAKTAKQFALPALVTTPREQLPEAAAAKQLDLFNYVAGTSQRSWLDQFKPASDKGGKTYERDGKKGKRAKLTAEQATKLLHDLCSGGAASLKTIHDKQAYIVLNDAELDGLIDHCTEVANAAAAWRKLTKAERKEALGERMAKTLAA